MPRYWWCIPLVLLGWLPIALADAPATEPSGGGAAGPTDVFRTFLQDIQHGNSADVARVCSARGEDAKGLVRDFQAVASAMEYLRTTVSLKFGPDAWGAVLPSLPTPADLDDVTETITGDQAQLTGANISTMRMIRVQGSWKVDVDGLLQSDEAPGEHPLALRHGPGDAPNRRRHSDGAADNGGGRRRGDGRARAGHTRRFHHTARNPALTWPRPNNKSNRCSPAPAPSRGGGSVRIS